ncbi:hypothetical protein B566_EDAN003971 [Ephemera danica]|nr:hypothetical protein B566_EDAN003971 [Ephemera danica]
MALVNSVLVAPPPQLWEEVSEADIPRRDPLYVVIPITIVFVIIFLTGMIGNVTFTVERYVAICHPLRSHTLSRLSRAVKLVLGIWVAALLLAVPQAIQFGIVTPNITTGGEELSQCTTKRVIVQHAFEISTFVFFVIESAQQENVFRRE